MLKAEFPLRGLVLISRLPEVKFGVSTPLLLMPFEGEIKPLVEQFLQKRGLELSPVKTMITHVEKGFDFLGQNVPRVSQRETAHQAFQEEH